MITTRLTGHTRDKHIADMEMRLQESNALRKRLNTLYLKHASEFDKYFELYVESPFFNEHDPKFSELIESYNHLQALGISKDDIRLLQMHFVANPAGLDFNLNYEMIIRAFSEVEL